MLRYKPIFIPPLEWERILLQSNTQRFFISIGKKNHLTADFSTFRSKESLKSSIRVKIQMSIMGAPPISSPFMKIPEYRIPAKCKVSFCERNLIILLYLSFHGFPRGLEKYIQLRYIYYTTNIQIFKSLIFLVLTGVRHGQ